MAEENTFLNADNIYEEVEGEAGKALTLEEEQILNLVGIVHLSQSIGNRIDHCGARCDPRPWRPIMAYSYGYVRTKFSTRTHMTADGCGYRTD